jgi:hypothetical protein
MIDRDAGGTECGRIVAFVGVCNAILALSHDTKKPLVSLRKPRVLLSSPGWARTTDTRINRLRVFCRYSRDVAGFDSDRDAGGTMFRPDCPATPTSVARATRGGKGEMAGFARAVEGLKTGSKTGLIEGINRAKNHQKPNVFACFRAVRTSKTLGFCVFLACFS